MSGQAETRSGSGRWRGVLIFLAKLALSAALIGFVLARVSLAELREAVAQPRWPFFVAALGVYGLSAFCGAWQWSWVLKVAGIKAPSNEIRRVYFIGLFFNNFLPANVGGDAYKVIDLGRHDQRRLGVFCATLLDRLIGLGALTTLAVLVLAFASIRDVPLPRTALLMIPVMVLLAVILALLLSRRLGHFIPGLARRLGLGGLGRQLSRITAEFGLYRPRVRWLNGIFAFSLMIQFLRMATHLLVALGLGYALTWDQALQLLVLIPMLAVSLTLPITINGIGLRESVSANLLPWAGLAEPHAVAMEGAAFLVQVLFSLQGGILLWLGRWQGHGTEQDGRN